MNICFTLSSLSAGGAERVATTLANCFSKKGHRVTLILVSIDINNSFYDIESGVEIIPLLKKPRDKRPFRRVKILRECIKSINPDIVIAFLPHICAYTYFALKNTGIPFICSERNDPNQYNLFFKALLKIAFSKADGCVFQTKEASNFYKKVKENKKTIIFNPVFIDASKGAIRKTEKDKIFLSVGRLTKQKNFPLLISSFFDVHTKHPEYRLIIYGEGPLRNNLEELIRKLGLQDSVSLPGTNSKWHDVAINATGFISSSNYEGMPNCLEEALCLGCPSIATDCPVGGSRELISLLNSGSLVETNNKKQLVSKMLKLIEKKDDNHLINYNVLKPNAIANQWIQFILKILEK